MNTNTPTRPVMTRAELAAHKTACSERDYRLSDDGYGDMEVAQAQGWEPIPGWGADGWDLGDWPYVAIYFRARTGLGPFEVRQICEGDSTVWTFAAHDDARAAIDYLFLWYGIAKDHVAWAEAGIAGWDDTTKTYPARDALDAGTLAVPERFRGPYRSDR